MTIQHILVWSKVGGVDSGGYAVTGADLCINFDKEFWFDLGNSM